MPAGRCLWALQHALQQALAVHCTFNDNFSHLSHYTSIIHRLRPAIRGACRFELACRAYVQLMQVDYAATICCTCPAADVQDPAGPPGALLSFPEGVPRHVVMDGIHLNYKLDQ